MFDVRFEECVFKMEEEVNELRPMSKRSKKTSSDEEEHLRVAVHCGPKEEMIAMATIDMDDINTLVCLLVVFLCYLQMTALKTCHLCINPIF